MGLGPLFLIFTAVVLGGIGSAYGALVAGLALGLAMELSTWDVLFGGLDSKYKPVLAFVVLILLLLYRPQGSSARRGCSDGDLQPPLLGLRGGDRRHLHDLRARPLPPVRAGRSAQLRPRRLRGVGRLHDGHPDHPPQRPDAIGGPRRVARRRPLQPRARHPLLRCAPTTWRATIAGAEIVRYLALNMQGLTGGPIGSIGMLGPSQLAQYNQSWEALLRPIVAASETPFSPCRQPRFAMLLIVWVIALILLVVFWLMVRSPWGRMMRAIREDEDAAAAVGKNVFRAKLQC